MTNNTVVIYSGRFQPFHKGHYATYMQLLKKFPNADVYIATSNKTDSEKSPFNYSEKQFIMHKMFNIPLKWIVQVKNPYNPFEILSQYDPEKTVYITCVGEKDSQRLGGKYFTPLKSLKNLNSYKTNGYVYISPTLANPISGTDARRWLSVQDDSEAKENFFKVYPKFDKNVFNLIRKKLKSMNENILLKIAFDSELKQMILLSNAKTLKETFGWYDEKYFNKLNESIIQDIIENPQPNDSDYINKFTSFCKKYLQLDTHPKIELVNNNEFAEKNKTLGYYDLDNNSIKVCIKGRLLADIMRTIAHEMVHHKQRELGHKMDGSTGSKVENSANIIAAMLMRKFGEGHSKIFSEMTEMSYQTVRAIDAYADELFGMDVDLGKQQDHFFDRLNDPRNETEITDSELKSFFERLSKKKDIFLKFLEKYKNEVVVKDVKTKINIPFMKRANKLIAKTIMRKQNFKTSGEDFILHEKMDDVVYIEFMNKEKGFRKDRIEFKGKHAYKDAVKWGENNIDNFKIDMVKFENDLYETIKKVGDKYVVYPKKGGNRLGTHDTLKGAKKQLAAIEINKESTNEDVTLPVNIGDVVLMGKFKNKKVVVKHIGKDEHGMPTINGKKATTFRIMPKKDLSENILLEGGAYGHMSHPFDIDMNLTFGDLKDIVKKALSGQLELAREKTDGQALAVSWKNNRLVAARNKGHLANAGENALTANELITKFEGRGEVSDAFKFAIEDLEKAISQLSDSQKKSIFKDGKAFMNCEVIYPESANVIPYGQALLVFHGTMEYDEKGNPISENPKTGGILAKMIKDINADVQDKFSIQGPPVQKLPDNENLKKRAPIYLQKINKIQSEFNLKDSDGVQDYHQAWWENWVDKNSPSKLTPEEKMGLVKRWAFDDKSFRLNTIKDASVKAWADKTDKMDRQRISKQNLIKFEEIFLGVGADVLSFMTSVLTINPDEAKRKMLDNLNSTIQTIRATGDAKSLDKLELELGRLDKLGGFDKIVPNEGLVFNYKGNTYKLTGAFAPLNQILGIFKYSR